MINFTLYQNKRGTWCVLFPGTMQDMPGNNRLQALLHVANMLRETQSNLEAMVRDERKANALEASASLGVMYAPLPRESQGVPIASPDGLLSN